MPRDKTAVEVAALRRKPGAHRVAPNLYLLVRPSSGGSLRSSWVLRYEKTGADGRRIGKHLGLGSTTTFSLAEAKERARRYRQMLAEGVDPLQAKRSKLAAAKLEQAKALSFGQAAAQLIATHGLSWKSKKHSAQFRSTFEGSSRSKPATECINDLPISAIDTALALKVLQPIWKRTPETGSRVRQRCESVLAWASARGLREGPNPFQWRGHLDRLLPQSRKVRSRQHYAAMPYAELPAFMVELRACASISARALEFTILTAARTGEVLGATWSEVDMAAKVWTISPQRMKSNKEHRVPLSDRVLDLLAALPREDLTPYLFLGARRGKAPSPMAMLELLGTMRPGAATVHGFRSTFRNWAAERTAFPHHICEQALAHTVHSEVEKAYLRSDVIEKRRKLMEAWSAYCASPPAAEAGKNVVSLK